MASGGQVNLLALFPTWLTSGLQDLGEGVLGSVESGVVAMLTTAISDVFLGWAGWDLFLACGALVTIAHHVGKSGAFTRLGALGEQILFSIMFNLVLAAATPADPGLALCNLLSVFLLASSLEESRLSGSAQFASPSRCPVCTLLG